MLLALMPVIWPVGGRAQTGDAQSVNGHPFDIGVIIDNRPVATGAAREDVDRLIKMLDQHMFIEHVMVLERPTIEVVCDIFGCREPIEATNPFPPLIWQITSENAARLLVYYLGDGRVEGLERQLLFRRRGGGHPDDVVPFPVDWLHATLAEAAPKSTVLMLDTSFSPRPLPCASDDPEMIDDALLSVRQNYRRIMRNHRVPADHVELGATTPVQPPHCDRFDQVMNDTVRPLFTKFLLKGITEGEADLEPFGDEDRLIDLDEIAAYLDDRISRAVRFQWGRLQNVRAAGPGSKTLASVDRRALSPDNEKLLERRSRPIIDSEAIVSDRSERSRSAALGGDRIEQIRPVDAAARCREQPLAADCHPCVINPDGPACAERCRRDGGSDLCAPGLAVAADDVSGSDLSGELVASAILDQQGERIVDQLTEQTAVCSWFAREVAPFTATLVQRIWGDTTPSCAWAVDRSPLELGPFAQIFTPIAWRLGRSGVQNAVICLLDCEGDPKVAASAVRTVLKTPLTKEARRVDPRSLGAFNREICDRLPEPLPPYIGLPRWMPGPLIVSETLRAVQGCPPLPPEPALPVPIMVAIEKPPEAGTPAPSPDRADPDQAGAVAAADDRLADWPRYAAGTDLAPGTTRTSSAGGGRKVADSSLDVSVDELSSKAEEHFAPTVGRVRWLQSALTVDNRSPGPIDGVLGRQTMGAIRSWRADNGRAERSGALTEAEFEQIIEDFGRRFEQIHTIAPSF